MASPYLAQPGRFFNRVHELAALKRGFTSRAQPGQLLLLYGRRRLGKTFLLQRFFAGAPGETPKRYCYYLADQTTAYAQRRALAEQLLEAFPDPGASPEDLAISWNALLRFVTQQAPAQGERVALILDEFPYLVQQTPELPSILQSWWDREGIHSRLFVVLCGSQLSAMQALGAASAPLFGRFNAGILALSPLGYPEVADFYRGSPQYDVPHTLMMYGVFGGTPRYHALVDTDRPFGEELVDLLLRPGGALESEVNYLLSSEQIREPAPYNAVLGAIAMGETQFGGILNALGMDRGGLSYYLSTLMELGWIRREFPFEEKSERRALYQVADPFLTFWYRCIRPLASTAMFADPQALYESRIAPQLSRYMGSYVFESICHQWLQRQGAVALGAELQSAGRWWSRDGQIELDIVARRTGGGYLFGECKWSATSPVDMHVYTQLLGKVARHPEASWREGASYVLFSLGGFTSELEAVAAGSGGNLHLVGPEAILPG